ncbi:MAG: type VI secretion system ATPase TssH [Pseudomonadota bacterium]
MNKIAVDGRLKRKDLVGRLNPVCLQAFSNAAQSAKTRGNPYVELVHFIESLAQSKQSDFDVILRAAEIDFGKLDADIARSTDALSRGAGSVEEFSDHIFRAMRMAANLGAVEFGDDQIRSCYLILAMMQDEVLESLLLRISLEFEKIDPASLSTALDDLLTVSIEGYLAPQDTAASPGRTAQSALSQYATDLTARARDGKIDPVIGRDAEIRQIIDILMRRRQNNPILTGEAGVGKTAVVEGFALRLAENDVPPQLTDVDLYMLDIALMQAGASMKGEFEKRLKMLIDEVQSSPRPIILFIDEAHALIGAGGAAGTGDAANILKPALARGELRTIAATTWSEYKEHIEKDPALTRRFQVVKIEEPSEDMAIRMLRGVAGVLERHHTVEILDEAIASAVTLSHRYIPARQLPDKAISLLDTVCARVSVSQHSTPAQVEDLRRRQSSLEIEKAVIDREAAIGVDVTTRRDDVTAELEDLANTLRDAEDRWENETKLVQDILDLRSTLRGDGAPIDPEPGEDQIDPDMIEMRSNLAELTSKLETIQGERPMVLPSVDSLAVASVVQDWTGVPLGRMLKSETEHVINLAETLAERVFGQNHALGLIANRVQTAQAGLGDPNKPIGVFLLCGPSGVGKTETALALADTLYGGEQNLITINMSEYQEAHTVSTLKGSPPGYVGYGKGGVLTEAVRRRPYSVILLDEVEKAHPDVHEIFFQVFDKGMMDDSEGRRIDFRNTLILLTSNVGTELIMNRTAEGADRVDHEALLEDLRPELLRVFPAALLGRLLPIPYYPLSSEMIETIAGFQINRIRKRLKKSHDVALEIGDGVVDLIISRCNDPASGGRAIDAILTNSLLPNLSLELLKRSVAGDGPDRVTVRVENNNFVYDFHGSDISLEGVS